MDRLLKIIQQRGRLDDETLSRESGYSPEEVREKVTEWQENGTILGYQGIIDKSKSSVKSVSAFIEVKITPERGGGFDRLATRIAKFDQVKSCYLFSGGYDLIVVVEGKDLMEVAQFVSEKLSTIEGVLSTQTHFQLKTYKQNGLLFQSEESEERLPVTP